MTWPGADSQLVLGTAQLGMDYGIANATGLPTASVAQELVRAAWHEGVRCFDTAPAYGASEMILGDALAACTGTEPEIVSKLNTGIDINEVDAVVTSVQTSLGRLKVERLWGLLLHDENALDAWTNGGGEGLAAVREMGLVGRLGVSVYSPERALQALNRKDVDIIQIPANLFDRRMARAGIFALAHRLGKIVFVRSVFLQGLMFLSPEAATNRIPFAGDAVKTLRLFCAEHKVSIRQFALHHIRHVAPQARLIIGAETLPQIHENSALFRLPPTAASAHAAWDELWEEDHLALIDPRRWPQK